MFSVLPLSILQAASIRFISWLFIYFLHTFTNNIIYEKIAALVTK